MCSIVLTCSSWARRRRPSSCIFRLRLGRAVTVLLLGCQRGFVTFVSFCFWFWFRFFFYFCCCCVQHRLDLFVLGVPSPRPFFVFLVLGVPSPPPFLYFSSSSWTCRLLAFLVLGVSSPSPFLSFPSWVCRPLLIFPFLCVCDCCSTWEPFR